MKFLKGLSYFCLSLICYLALAFIEYYLCQGLVDMLSTNWVFHLVTLVLFLVFINPFITYVIMKLYNYKADGLIVEKGLNNELKKEVKLDIDKKAQKTNTK